MMPSDIVRRSGNENAVEETESSSSRIASSLNLRRNLMNSFCRSLREGSALIHVEPFMAYEGLLPGEKREGKRVLVENDSKLAGYDSIRKASRGLASADLFIRDGNTMCPAANRLARLTSRSRKTSGVPNYSWPRSARSW